MSQISEFSLVVLLVLANPQVTEERGIVIGDDFIEAYVADLARFYEELFDAWAQTH